jgi:hypothetical protein
MSNDTATSDGTTTSDQAATADVTAEVPAEGSPTASGPDLSLTPEDLSHLSLPDLIEQLYEVPVPPAVPMVPQTTGWLVLALILLTALAYAIWRARQKHRANAYRRAALAELALAGDDPARIAGILRRTALVAFDRASVAGLTGADWLAFLDGSFPGKGFATATVLTTAPYRPADPAPDLTRLARDWIRTHHAEAN